MDNQSAALGGGAGIQSAQFIASKGVSAVITGNCGPNAVRTLSAAGINVILGQTGTVRDAVEKFKRGDLSAASEANVESHYGTGMGSGPGRGMGRGHGNGEAKQAHFLKEETEDRMRKIQEIKRRITALENAEKPS